MIPYMAVNAALKILFNKIYLVSNTASKNKTLKKLKKVSQKSFYVRKFTPNYITFWIKMFAS